MSSCGYIVLYGAYLLTKLLRWFPAAAVAILAGLFYDAFYTESPLLDSWSEEGSAKASTSWAHFTVWTIGAWLLFEGTVWPLFLYHRSQAYTATPAANPPMDGQREAIFTAMCQSFATFQKVRAHPAGSPAAKMQLKVRAVRTCELASG